MKSCVFFSKIIVHINEKMTNIKIMNKE